jgi:hypothetical protein
MTKTIVPWQATSKELQEAIDSDETVSAKCLELKKMSIESKHALFLEIRKDPKRKITYEEFLGIGEVFGDVKAICKPQDHFISKQDAYNLIKQLLYFATAGRKANLDYDDQQMILQFAKIRLSFFE